MHTGLLICQRYHVSPHPMCHNSGISQPVYAFYTDDETRIYIHIPFLRRYIFSLLSHWLKDPNSALVESPCDLAYPKIFQPPIISHLL